MRLSPRGEDRLWPYNAAARPRPGSPWSGATYTCSDCYCGRSVMDVSNGHFSMDCRNMKYLMDICSWTVSVWSNPMNFLHGLSPYGPSLWTFVHGLLMKLPPWTILHQLPSRNFFIYCLIAIVVVSSWTFPMNILHGLLSYGLSLYTFVRGLLMNYLRGLVFINFLHDLS